MRKLIIFSMVFFSMIIMGRELLRIAVADVTPTPSVSPTPTDNSQTISDLQNKIHDLEGKISDLQGQEKTLSSQIDVMDSQINLTELRIDSTQRQITDLALNIDTTKKKINSLEGSLDGLTKVLLSRIVATYEIGNSQPLELIASSNTITDYFSRANYLRIAQEHDKMLVYDTVQAKNDYSNQQKIFVDEKKKQEQLQSQLQDYTTQLDTQKDQKKKLLADTQGNEINYQKLLSQAEAQLAGFSQFASSQGGASLLSGQTYCDDWGCYYNQRDSQWGGLSLNGTKYTIASDGCLVTSVAMMMTHYGHKTTPLDINSNPNNFASYYPAYLLYTVTANGATSQRIGSTIDSNLANGNPVIVGINHPSGGTHFLVLKTKVSGDYIMDDPFTPNGHDILFSSHYSVGSIFEVDKVEML